MHDAVLLALVMGTFVFGYFVMVKMGSFLDENRKSIQHEREKQEPSCVMLMDDLTEEEILEEIRHFRKAHSASRIVLYNCSEKELPEQKDPFSA